MRDTYFFFAFFLVSLAAFLFLTKAAHAQALYPNGYSRDNYRDIRWLGRGNTGVADVDDASSVFYNPAGLGANLDTYGLNLPLSAAANQNFYTSFAQIPGLTGGSTTLDQKFAPFLGEPLALQGSTFPSIVIPHFSIGFWDYADTSVKFRNPVYPNLDVDVRNDWGIVLGYGYSFEDRFFVGASLRYQERTSIAQDVTLDTMVTANASTLTALEQKGHGWGLNLGAQFRQPISDRQSFSLGLAIEDFGNTTFINGNPALLPPAPQLQKINLGTASNLSTTALDMKFLIDTRDLMAPESFTKKLYMGSEFSIPLMDLRAGLFQGYWTLGASLYLLPFLSMDMASYGEELDATAGQRENRFYMLGMTINLELKQAKEKKQRFTLDQY